MNQRDDAPHGELIASLRDEANYYAEEASDHSTAAVCRKAADLIVQLLQERAISYAVSEIAPQEPAGNCASCGHGNRLNGKIVHAPNCPIGYPSSQPCVVAPHAELAKRVGVLRRAMFNDETSTSGSDALLSEVMNALSPSER